MTQAHIILMGVSGCGKSTVGVKLAEALGRPFIEGDEFHPPANIEKMSSGIPLTNADRKGWIADLCQHLQGTPASVVACSALNPYVRSWLEQGLDRPVLYVHLVGSVGTLRQRLSARPDHFFAADLLDSQIAALDPPPDAIPIDADLPVPAILDALTVALRTQGVS